MSIKLILIMLNNNSLVKALKKNVIYSLFISLFFILSCSDNNTNAVVENANIVVHGIQIKDVNQNVILRYFKNQYDSKYSNEIKVLEENEDEYFKIDLLDKNGKVIDTIPKNNFIFDMRLSDNKNFKIIIKYDDILSFKFENEINTEVKLSIYISANNIQNTKIENMNVNFSDFNEEKLTIVKEYDIYNRFWGTYMYSHTNTNNNKTIYTWYLRLVDSTKTFSLFISDTKGKFFDLKNKIHKLEVTLNKTKYFKIRQDYNWDDPTISFTLQGILKNEDFTNTILNIKLFQLFKGEYKVILDQNIAVEIN